jgi:hypothetical protein
MAPEQFQGRALPQTDLYAVGATAICMLSGQDPQTLPHQGLKIDVERVLGGDRELSWLLGQLLEPDPDRRPVALLPLLARLSGTRPSARPEPPPQALASAGSEGLPFPIWLFFVIGLTVARVAVFAGLGVFVPTLLTFLSVFFGPGLRRGAHAVRAASHTADTALERATRVVRGMPVEPLLQRSGRQRARVRVERGRKRSRVVDTTAEDMAEDAREDAGDFRQGRRARR